MEELFDVLAATIAPFGLELVDLEVKSALVRVVVDRPDGAELGTIEEATRAVSAALDAHDPLPDNRYTLEVTSPGLERPLRTPNHFRRAVGEQVSVRVRAGGQGERRWTGVLADADDEGFLLQGEGFDEDGRRFAYGEVERARTVFEWGGAPRPGGSAGRGHGGRGSDRERVTTP